MVSIPRFITGTLAGPDQDPANGDPPSPTSPRLHQPATGSFPVEQANRMKLMWVLGKTFLRVDGTATVIAMGCPIFRIAMGTAPAPVTKPGGGTPGYRLRGTRFLVGTGRDSVG